jgi:hypothetical protein
VTRTRLVTRSTKSKVSKPSGEEPSPLLIKFNLEKGTEIRFRRREENWTNGKVVGENADGSLELVDEHGKMRSIMPNKCQVKERGPRGGVTWKDVVE